MAPEDADRFASLMHGVHEFYGKKLSEFALSVWWQAMQPFDYDAVSAAFSSHLVNPDNGQWMPKPADVVRAMGGRTVDRAQRAWALLERAVRLVGPYRSVVFDDPLIHRVVEDMGGWIAVCSKREPDWPFAAREFESRYRGYALQGGAQEFASHLVGLAEAENARCGFPIEDPALLGDVERALAVYRNGGASNAKGWLQLGEAMRRLGNDSA